MEKYITDERTGLKYELVGDYYFIAGDDEPEERPIGMWVQRMNSVRETATEIVNNELIYASQTYGGGEQSLPPFSIWN